MGRGMRGKQGNEGYEGSEQTLFRLLYRELIHYSLIKFALTLGRWV